MVVDHAHGLHQRVADGRAHEAKAAPLQLPAHRPRLVGLGRQVRERAPAVFPRLTAHEPPQQTVERLARVAQRQDRARVCDRRLHLQAVPHDRRVRQEALDVAGAEPRHPLGIEAGERLPVSLPLAQDRGPGKTGLCPFEGQHLVQVALIVGGNSPFLVVVGQVERVTGRRPFAASWHPGQYHVRRWATAASEALPCPNFGPSRARGACRADEVRALARRRAGLLCERAVVAAGRLSLSRAAVSRVDPCSRRASEREVRDSPACRASGRKRRSQETVGDRAPVRGAWIRATFRRSTGPAPPELIRSRRPAGPLRNGPARDDLRRSARVARSTNAVIDRWRAVTGTPRRRVTSSRARRRWTHHDAGRVGVARDGYGHLDRAMLSVADTESSAAALAWRAQHLRRSSHSRHRSPCRLSSGRRPHRRRPCGMQPPLREAMADRPGAESSASSCSLVTTPCCSAVKSRACGSSGRHGSRKDRTRRSLKRRGWDSNPRSRLTRDSGFQDRRIRPLCHPSVRPTALR